MFGVCVGETHVQLNANVHATLYKDSHLCDGARPWIPDSMRFLFS